MRKYFWLGFIIKPALNLVYIVMRGSRGPTVALLGATISVTAWLGGLPRNQASPAALARTVEDLTLRGSIFSRTSDVATSGNRKYAL